MLCLRGLELYSRWVPLSSSRNRIDSKLPCAPPLTQLEFEVFGSSAGISVDTNVEELDDSEDTSTGDDDEQQTTEAMAMQCLAGLVNRTAMPLQLVLLVMS